MASTARINRRIVNSKRHTVGFRLTGNRAVSRRQAVAMARRGEIAGVHVMGSGNSSYIVSSGNRNLYDLPIEVDNSVNPNATR